MSRKPVSKGLRFDIFNRDGFTCQYCGKRPPDIVLELDHVQAVIDGGTNDEINLVTACVDCNRGKSAKKLGDIAPRPDADLRYLAAQQEIAEAHRYMIAKAEREKAWSSVANALYLLWIDLFGRDDTPPIPQWRNWLTLHSAGDIEMAINLASATLKPKATTVQRIRKVSQLLKQPRGGAQ